jgi:large subunit ribosomal protein L24
MAKMKLKKGDMVIVVSGKDKGKSGAIARVLPKENRLIVEGVGMVKRHLRKTSRGQSGRIVERPASIHASNVMLKDPEGGKPTRVGRKVEGGKIIRIAKKSGKTLK